MKITTKGRYAVAVMLELAYNYEKDEFLSLKDISEKEGISLKYIEKIMLDLKKEDFFITSRGQEGGYKLKYSPDKYPIGKIINAVENPIWKDLNDEMNNYLNSKTLKDYIERK